VPAGRDASESLERLHRSETAVPDDEDELRLQAVEKVDELQLVGRRALIRLRSCRPDRERDHARGHEDALSDAPHARHLFSPRHHKNRRVPSAADE
jgi:hypothetical protein